MGTRNQMALPKSFIDLDRAYTSPTNSFVNIIGVAVDVMPPGTTSSGQYMLTFKLLDPSLRDSAWSSPGLTARFFKADPATLPKVRQIGDVVLLRNVKISSFNQQPLAISNYQTEVTVFPGTSIPAPNFEIAYQGRERLEALGIPLEVRKTTLEEQAYVIRLKAEMGDHLHSLPNNIRTADVAYPPNAPTAPAAVRQRPDEDSTNPVAAGLAPNAPNAPMAMRKRPGEDLVDPNTAKKSKLGKKFRLIRELQHRDFADICVQVVKKFPTNFGTCELYVTDYTENDEMFYYEAPEEKTGEERDGDPYNYTTAPKRAWTGPFGFLVLKVNIKDPHATYANREVEEGDFVLLRNVKMKMMTRLEGDMWPDSFNPEKVQISKSKDLEIPEITAVEERKAKYWNKRKRKFPGADQEPEKKKTTRTEKKKQKKQRAAEQAVEKPEGQKSAANGVKPVDINQHVRCSHEDVPISSIRDVLDPTNEMHKITTPDGMEYVLPFMNVRYRTRVRVVDFDPKQLEDFAVPSLVKHPDDRSNSPDMNLESSAKYVWSFSLQLEDASKSKDSSPEESRIWVNFQHQDAQYLFGNDVPDPEDLKDHPLLLAKLKEKLCILWGNLEEKAADEQASNRPFECCIAEYGTETDDDYPDRAVYPLGFKRMYSMFGVTIL